MAKAGLKTATNYTWYVGLTNLAKRKLGEGMPIGDVQHWIDKQLARRNAETITAVTIMPGLYWKIDVDLPPLDWDVRSRLRLAVKDVVNELIEAGVPADDINHWLQGLTALVGMDFQLAIEPYTDEEIEAFFNEEEDFAAD